MRTSLYPGARWCGLCCLAALVIRWFYLLEQSTTSVLFYQPTLDEREVMLTAEALLRGEGFGAEPLFKAPLYAVVMALSQIVFGDSWMWGIRLVQHAAGVLLVAMAGDTAARLVGGRAARRVWAFGVAAGLLAVYPPLIRLENRLILDIWVVVFQSAMVWACIRDASRKDTSSSLRWMLLAGCFAALAWLTRPTLTPALPFFAVGAACTLALIKERKVMRLLQRAACFGLLPLIAMGAVTVRNHVAGGEAMLLPWQGGYNLYHANRPGASGRYLLQESFTVSDEANPTRSLMMQGFQQAVSAGEVSEPGEEGGYSALNSYWMGRAVDSILDHPADWLGKMFQKTIYLFSQREIYNFEAFEVHKSESRLLRWIPLGFGWLWPLALMSLALPFSQDATQKRIKGLLWGYGVLTAGVIALVYVSGRLRMPLIFPVVVLASGSLVMLVETMRHRIQLSAAQVATTAGLCIVGIFMSWGDWWGVRSEVVAHHDLARMSNAAWRQREPERALAYARRAEELMPSYPPLVILKAQALYSLDKIEEAIPLYQQALEQNPLDPGPAFNLGVIYLRSLNDPAAAVPYFNETLRRHPPHRSARVFLILSRLRLGQVAAAREQLEPLLEDDPPDIRSRMAVVAVLRATGENEAAQARYQRWFAPLDSEQRALIDRELKTTVP